MIKRRITPLLITIGLFLAAMVAFVALAAVLTRSISKDKDDAKVRPYIAQIAEKDRKLEEYRKQVEQVIQIRDAYRSSVKDLVRTLYNKDTAMGVGGTSMDVSSATDEVVLLQLGNTVMSMNDDLKMLLEVKDYLDARKQFSDSFPFVWPINKGGVPVISSGFGFREKDEIKKDAKGVRFHEGIDIVGNLNDDIVATADGTVSKVVFGDPVLGNYLMIDHEYGFQTIYGHMNSIAAKKGQAVKRGQKIGKMGRTGIATGVHVHYEVHKDGTPMDPLLLIQTNY